MLKRASLSQLSPQLPAFPKLRSDLDFQLISHAHRSYYILKDPFQMAEKVFLFPSEYLAILRLFDGRHSMEDIFAEYEKHIDRASARKFVKFIKNLDRSYLLETRHYEKQLTRLSRIFHEQPTRPAAYAGMSYADDRDDLIREIDNYERQIRHSSPAPVRPAKKIMAIVSPHIDPRLGGAAYASVYRALKGTTTSLFLILGIAHRGMKNQFALTDKDFETPLGVVNADQAFIKRLAQKCTIDYFVDELAHRSEHSIEFQTLFLRHFLNRPFTIVPILCSFLHVLSDKELESFQEFVSALRATIAEEKRELILIAGVDLSHLGPQYGQNQIPDAFLLSQVEAFDRQILDALFARDAKRLDLLFEQTNNQYNVCGYPALRTLIELLPPSTPQIICYENVPMDENRSTVTFAGALFSTQ
ncbi:MAG: AmmeMemoRadiSam system protein B [Calditrichaeota bacterium]|nr:MAG: AmmeMemoRadiSam system protein B [Calditrichota bacterium]